VPTQEPLEESPCSMTMAKVAKKDREQGQRKRDARVGQHGSGYKGPQGGLSTPKHSIRQTTPLAPQGSHIGLMPCLGKANHSRRRFMPHLIMTMEPHEKATNWAPVAQLPTIVKTRHPHLPTHRCMKRHNSNYLA
jgi:hypothetical protein